MCIDVSSHTPESTSRLYALHREEAKEAPAATHEAPDPAGRRFGRCCTACGGQPDSQQEDAQDDGCQPWGYYVGECGHPVFGGPAWHVGPCDDCDPSAT
ncbi:MAG: hypothetical protein ACRDRA_07340 [Pseudonocardiaceae bacterium]